MNSTCVPARDDPLATLRDIVARARGAVQWLQLHIGRAVEGGELSAEDAEDISDQADEADEILLGPLDLLHPELKGMRDEGAGAFEQLAANVLLPDAEIGGDAVVPVLRSVLEETATLFTDRVPLALASLDAGHLGAGEIDRLHVDFDEAREAVEAALVALDPGRLSREMASLRDPEERILRASEHERVELRGHIVRQTNEFWRKAE